MLLCRGDVWGHYGVLGSGIEPFDLLQIYEAKGDALRTIEYNVECVDYGLVKDSEIVVISSQLVNQECQRV